MTYFDPSIYNVDNLKPKDKSIVSFYFSLFNNIIDRCSASYTDISDHEILSLERIKRDVVDNFVDCLKDDVESEKTELCAAIIDNYEEDIINE